MKRKRIKATAICSSANYVASKKAHRTMLEINHRDNQSIFMAISNASITPKSDLELWEEGLKRKIAEFKANYNK